MLKLLPDDSEILPVGSPDVSSDDIVQAKFNTLDIMVGEGEVDDEDLVPNKLLDRLEAKRVFDDATIRPEPKKAKENALALTTPAGTAYAASMLQAYDLDYVARIANIRSFVVTRLVEEAAVESRNAPKDRLRALEMLGKISDVGLFETRINVNISQTPEVEIERRLMEKIKKYEVIDITPTEPHDDDKEAT